MDYQYRQMWTRLKDELKEWSQAYHVKLMDAPDFEAFRQSQGRLLAWNDVWNTITTIEEETLKRSPREDTDDGRD